MPQYPHCERQFRQIDDHKCAESPAVFAWLSARLPDPMRPGCIVTVTEYAAMPDAPVQVKALVRAYGSWHGLAKRHGLRVRRKIGSAPARYTNGVPGIDPISMAELHRLANELHNGEFGPSLNEFDAYARNTPLAGYGLAKRYGKAWSKVLEAAGLRHGTRSEYVRAARARRQAHQTPQNARGTLDRGDEPISREYTGIPVMPNPRQLPSGGVAWTVR